MQPYENPIKDGRCNIPTVAEMTVILRSFLDDLKADRCFTEADVEALRLQIVLFGPLTQPKRSDYPPPLVLLISIREHLDRGPLLGSADERTFRYDLCRSPLSTRSDRVEAIELMIDLVERALKELAETDYEPPRR